MEVHVGSPAVVIAVIEDHIPEHLAVGDDDLEVVERRQLGDEQVERAHPAGAAGALDDVADPIGPEQEDHHTRRHVGQGALHRQADRQRGGADGGDDRGGLDPQLRQHGDAAHDVDGVAGQGGDEDRQGRVVPVPAIDPDQRLAGQLAGP